MNKRYLTINKENNNKMTKMYNMRLHDFINYPLLNNILRHKCQSEAINVYLVFIMFVSLMLHFPIVQI